MARYDIAGLQYEDNAGNPLIGGKLYFYDSGTTTAKVTFSDIDETTANANPVVLDASGRAGDIYFSGSAKIIIKDSNDVTIDEKDPVTASGSAGGRLSFSVWNALSTYSASDLVTASDSKYYRCIVASSQGQEPSATAASWTEVRFLGLWNTNQTYAIKDIAQGSDGSLYTALAAQAGNDPTSDAVNWRETAISSLIKDTTPQLGGDLSANGHQIQWSKGADVASATELPLVSDGNYFDVTGTSTATSFADLPIGTLVKLHFDGVLTLTNNADIVCLSAANVTTEAGDEAEFVFFDTGKVRMTNYSRADGTGLVSAGGVAENEQVFNSSGTWTKPDSGTYALIENIGAGGSGSQNTGADTNVGGGGGGEYSSILILLSDLGATETVTIGAGASGVANGVSSVGADGGSTTFGSHLTARGGKGATGASGSSGEGGDGTIGTNSKGQGGFGCSSGAYGSQTGPRCTKGGAGGGGAHSSTSNYAGGVSLLGGNGGEGKGQAGVAGGDGVQPGGGGGASTNNGGSGAGGAGRSTITVW